MPMRLRRVAFGRVCAGHKTHPLWERAADSSARSVRVLAIVNTPVAVDH